MLELMVECIFSLSFLYYFSVKCSADGAEQKAANHWERCRGEERRGGEKRRGDRLFTRSFLQPLQAHCPISWLFTPLRCLHVCLLLSLSVCPPPP